MSNIPATLLENTPVFSRLVQPRTAQDRKEAENIFQQITDMEVIEVELHAHEFTRLPLVRLRYTSADMPEVWWSGYLWAQVRTDSGRGWLLRLVMIARARHELYLRPLPNRLEERIALEAIDQPTPPRITEIRLGLAYPRTLTRRITFLERPTWVVRAI